MRLLRYGLGQTRVYFKGGVLEELEGRRSVVLQQSATLIQRFARGTRKRRIFQLKKAAVLKMQAFVRMLRSRLAFGRIRNYVIRLQVCPCPELSSVFQSAAC
jgi:myosin heavy subunit